MFLHYALRKTQAAEEWAKKALAFSTEHQFSFYLALTTHYNGRVLADHGLVEAGIRQMRQGIAQQTSATEQALPIMLAILPETCIKAGLMDDAIKSLDEALAVVERTSERNYEAEIHRIKGELLWMRGDESEAESKFQQAMAVARVQQGRSLELRATMSLCRLWQKQGKIREASNTLASIYGWFTEGFDTPDILDAKALLDQLS
jgi:predicted ATPase